ncbi:MAG TPA: dolichyl-phosphate beta-D-mannosyltransferase [Cryomorphaceae bacterium]|nr:dolichyl-phosphate beta-D-mannosyltransferase [Owenweeksia sp.]MBF99918.1 dolichyl-phosphate beta-D-mannosyltransferase [Owenweeksia sp.]HAD98433.1 dolichyl-phosphate beta-D-mannosyltransferase [Cryomorphaceae bacterium]HCQ14633.1 dolichyl-phosphate beta-D-mannosyltransferase [Cryomorphaceae bacterium]
MSKGLVIIPTYNEKENIERIIRRVYSLSEPFHILVVDDGSPDGTADIVKSLQTEFPEQLFILERKGKQGLGTAYLKGFEWGLARDYEFFFEMDADFSHNPDDLVRLYQCSVKENKDVVVGSRYIKGVNVVNWPMSRVLLSYFASRYVRVILGIPVEDTTAGFMCYRRKVLETINFKKIKFVGYAFQIEMKYVAYKMGFSIMEIPVIFTDRTLGKSKMSQNIIREAVFGVLQLKMRNILRRYK